jgi:SpoU rRNA methylase family enzyme
MVAGLFHQAQCVWAVAGSPAAISGVSTAVALAARRAHRSLCLPQLQAASRGCRDGGD